MNKTIFLIFSALLFGCELKEEKIKNIIKINKPAELNINQKYLDQFLDIL